MFISNVYIRHEHLRAGFHLHNIYASDYFATFSFVIYQFYHDWESKLTGGTYRALSNRQINSRRASRAARARSGSGSEVRW